MLKAVAKPGDFVAFKLDIDNSAVEIPILKALTEDPEALALVDEFFFEHRGSLAFLSGFRVLCQSCLCLFFPLVLPRFPVLLGSFQVCVLCRRAVPTPLKALAQEQSLLNHWLFWGVNPEGDHQARNPTPPKKTPRKLQATSSHAHTSIPPTNQTKQPIPHTRKKTKLLPANYPPPLLNPLPPPHP
jgi:hypothetical protein